MKFNFLVICISIFALLSCNVSSEKIIDELSIIIISSDISIGENVINFAVLDINGNQINDDLNEIKLNKENSCQNHLFQLQQQVFIVKIPLDHRKKMTNLEIIFLVLL